MVIYDDNATFATTSSTLTVGHGEIKRNDGHSSMPIRRGGKMRRRHSVDFKPPEQQTQVRAIEPLEEEARAVCWYSREEYDIIKARNSLIVKMMKTGHFRETDEHSFRGLEHKLKEGFKQRRANKFAALNAVLEEQDRQLAMGVKEPERIAKKYRRVSLNAAETAFVVGVRDAEESLGYLGNTSSPQNSMTFNDYHSPRQSFYNTPPSPEYLPTSSDYMSRSSDEHSILPVTAVVASGDDNCSCMTPSIQCDDSYDADTIASEESSAPIPEHHHHKEQVRGLFAAASYLKRTGGRMGRRSSM